MAQASKVHAYSFDPERAMPVAIAKAYHTWGLRGVQVRIHAESHLE